MSLGFDAALTALQARYSDAQPNSGFAEQLRLFVDMGCRIDRDNEAYKRFRLQQLGVERAGSGHEGAHCSGAPDAKNGSGPQPGTNTVEAPDFENDLSQQV
jgi:hypothetical protein